MEKKKVKEKGKSERKGRVGSEGERSKGKEADR